MSEKRPKVKIHFKYNKETGEVEEFVIDDNSPTASEPYHDKVARLISSQLSKKIEIEDAGSRLLHPGESTPLTGSEKKKQTNEEKEKTME